MRLHPCLWLLSLAGCTSLAPVYQAPPLPVASAYCTDCSADGDGVAAPAWRDYFSDPGLQALIALALQQNRDLRIAALRVEEARAAYGIARADQLPTLALGLDGTRTRVPADLNLSMHSPPADAHQRSHAATNRIGNRKHLIQVIRVSCVGV